MFFAWTSMTFQKINISIVGSLEDDDTCSVIISYGFLFAQYPNFDTLQFKPLILRNKAT